MSDQGPWVLAEQPVLTVLVRAVTMVEVLVDRPLVAVEAALLTSAQSAATMAVFWLSQEVGAAESVMRNASRMVLINLSCHSFKH
jgi:hypothetical protein